MWHVPQSADEREETGAGSPIFTAPDSRLMSPDFRNVARATFKEQLRRVGLIPRSSQI